jgi:hypothetical protein
MKSSEVSTNPPVLPNIYRYQGWWRVRWSGKDEPDARAARFVYRLNLPSLSRLDPRWLKGGEKND